MNYEFATLNTTTQNSKFKIQNARSAQFKIQNSKFKTQNSLPSRRCAATSRRAATEVSAEAAS
ncbi:MAG: hypothetical protein SPD86_06120, partial [Prevotella sp.]|nr:hypothetical protein [Prevotella sp.]